MKLRPGTLAIIALAAIVAIVATLIVKRDDLHAISVHANEEQAIADLIEFGSVQIQFAMYVGGGYGTLRMLSDPQSPPNDGGRTIAHRRFLWPVRNGYRFVLRPGPADPNIPMLTPGTLRSFTYIAYPIMADAPGARSFLYDSNRSMIHYRTDGLEPELTDPEAVPAQ